MLPLPEVTDHLAEDFMLPNAEVDPIHQVTTGLQLRFVLVPGSFLVFSLLSRLLFALSVEDLELFLLMPIVLSGY